ncbi:glycosyltransferase family 4 protein [Roseimaritima ulvae]|nr:glycosyltransferase family 4 protein [Roseimaritima ulvae]
MQIITRNELRGAEVFATTLSEALLRRQHRVSIPAIYTTSAAAFDLVGAEHMELGGVRKGKLERRPLMNLRRFIQSVQPDIIQANGFHALKYAVLATVCSPRRAPIVYRNISLASDWVRGGVRRRWGSWLFRHVDFVTSVSQQCADNLCRTYGYPSDRTCVIRRGIEYPDHLDAAYAKSCIREEIKASPSAPVLMHTGGFTVEKNHAGLLDAFRIVCEQRDDIQLVLCGDGPLLREVQQQAANLGLNERVCFLGNRTDAARLVAGADVFVLPSHVEGIPGVVLEAAAQGVPAVCTRVGGLEEAVLDGETGVLVPPDDSRQLARAVLHLLDDDSLRQSMGQAAREHISKHFRLQRAVDEFEQLYESLVAGPPERASQR